MLLTQSKMDVLQQPDGASSFVLCVDSAPGKDPDENQAHRTKWGTGIRWGYHDDEQGYGSLLSWGEDVTSGFCDQTKYDGQVVLDHQVGKQPNIGAVETFGMARQMWFLATCVPPGPRIFAITDRMPSVKNLEKHDGIDFRLSYTRSFRLAMKMFRVYLCQALRRHGRIRFEHYEFRGYNSSWRVDQLSRLFVGTRVHPMRVIEDDDVTILFNYNADNDQRQWNKEMFAHQTIALI